MDILKKKIWKKFMILWKISSSSSSSSSLTKSKSWSCTRTSRLSSSTPSSTADENQKKKGLITPEGCFSVYVGPQKQRFLVKTEFANHPLFRTLLDAAETEYGFSSDGPILLPCDVDLFYRVLAEMDDNGGGDDPENNIGCCSPLVLYSPRRSVVSISTVGKRSYSYGSYRFLRSSRLLKLNQ